MLFDELKDIQREFGYLPPAKLTDLAARKQIPLHRVHEVASFYPFFYLEPQPKVTVGVCRDLSCHMAGSGKLFHHLKQRFQPGGAGIEVREISCPGRCDTAPAISINQVFVSHIRGERC